MGPESEEFMKAVIFLLFSLSALAQDAPKKACVIVNHHKHQFSDNFWIMHKPFDYIEGDFPEGMKFRPALSSKDIQAMQEHGSKVVIIKADYQLTELKDAREQCAAFTGPSMQTSDSKPAKADTKPAKAATKPAKATAAAQH